MINDISWTAIAVDVDLTIDPSVMRVTATRGALGPSLETLEIGFLRIGVGVQSLDGFTGGRYGRVANGFTNFWQTGFSGTAGTLTLATLTSTRAVDTFKGTGVEMYLIREGGEPKGKPAGFITIIDGHTRQYTEFTSSNFKKEPTSVRIVQVDADGKLQSDITSDLRQVDFRRRVAQADQEDMLQQFSRLLNGLQNLVLADQRNAQAVEDDPCHAD